ncbi:MAG: hypothetical protein B7Y39_09030 [Bdellovibrio sp. 28-41-41]|nr:MAG: hypothetical protein B7Y39_09030 [Bdellovibrio sp. 28-41-41]
MKDKSRINALIVIGGGPFPGSFGIVSNNEFNVGTSTSIMKFEILVLNKGSQFAILDDPNDPLVSVSILDSGAVVALSKTGQNLPFVD